MRCGSYFESLEPNNLRGLIKADEHIKDMMLEDEPSGSFCDVYKTGDLDGALSLVRKIKE